MVSRNELSILPESLKGFLPTNSRFDCEAICYHAQKSLSASIYNHSLRVYLLATRILEQKRASGAIFMTPAQSQVSFNNIQLDQIFAACMFHDMGTCSSCNGPHRFEVEGGNAAVTYLRSVDFKDGEALQSIWSAIAMHTSAGIAELIDPFTHLVRIAVKADLAPPIRDSLGLKDFAAEIEECLPRLEIEQCLAEAVVSQATNKEIDQGLYVDGARGRWTDSVKFPKASWPGVLLRGHLEKIRDEGEHWKGSNPAF